jgi:hypothetical protein
LISCYHVEDEAPYEDDPCNIQIIVIEGEREVESPSLWDLPGTQFGTLYNSLITFPLMLSLEIRTLSLMH